MPSVSYRIRKATPADRDAVLAMQEHSVRVLGRALYSKAVIESALRQFGTMDADVIDEGHFFVAVACGDTVIGSGGWSRRTPGYDSCEASAKVTGIDPTAFAIIRGVYVDPDWPARVSRPRSWRGPKPTRRPRTFPCFT